ncbi:MAG: glycine cleavage system aminomethyltransferase GcvT [Flavobacteriia bacterium]|nr:glycine cleavage system aminomethyltransferase GcvT [Flavobacteriia bacterium]
MKNTALLQKHLDANAKMVPFAGYNMPVQYEGVNIEHETVRNAVGVFDVSHMGEFFLRGPKALDLIQRVTTNDASVLFDGKAQYSCMPNGKGGIVDDLIIYRIHQEEYLLVVNASNIEKDWNWIASHNTEGVEMENASDRYSLLAIQGPKAAEAMQSLTQVNLSEMPYYTFVKGDFAGCSDIYISATDAVFAAGASFGIKPIGLAARDTLRLEMGFCLYGNDIDDTTSPLEAGLGWITKFTKDFVDAATLKAQKEQGISRKLIAFEMVERGIPRHDYRILDANGAEIGKVTSGTMSPSMKIGIGLGYVTKEHSALDSPIYVEIREKGVEAKVVKLPFYKK